MSKNYDNWERLVAAVIKREEIWQLCHQHSRTPSICSEASSSNFSSSFRSDFEPESVLIYPQKLSKERTGTSTLAQLLRRKVKVSGQGSSQPVMKKVKVVLKVDFADEKIKQRAMKKVSGLSGLESITLDLKDKKLTLTGDIDLGAVVHKLRKLSYTEVVSIGPAEEPKKAA